MIDIRKELNKHANRPVDYHFANLLDLGVQETLVTGGFGTFEPGTDNLAFPNTEAHTLADHTTEDNLAEKDSNGTVGDEENPIRKQKKLFHLSLEEAIAAAVESEW